MACFLPLPAWHTTDGKVLIGLKAPQTDATRLCLPCGKCEGCRLANAKAWALRCHLELSEHNAAAFTTLTYEDRWLPPTLEKRHLQLFLKRFRARLAPARSIRFFGSGEYGEKNGRPHYHAILFGAQAERDSAVIQDCWRMGHTYTVPATAATINYVAGYTAKKLGDSAREEREQVDPDTGEVYRWTPPFIQMSRRPGIGGEARKYTNSWRSYAVHNGTRQPVPRFLHEAWKKQATPEQLAALAAEKRQNQIERKTTLQMLEANHHITLAKQSIRAARRKL